MTTTGQRRKFSKKKREELEKVYAARRIKKIQRVRKERKTLKGTVAALNGIWEYLVDPRNHIENHDAENILKMIKDGLGERDQRE